jgi:hypothetical protein
MKKAELRAEGERYGAEFRLGRLTGTWTGISVVPRVPVGWVFLMTLACFIPLPLETTGLAQAIITVVWADLVVPAIVMVSVPPWVRRDRLYGYQQGFVLRQHKDAEPAALRWANLASVQRQTWTDSDGDEHVFVDFTDRAGTVLRLPQNFGRAREEIAAMAERALASPPAADEPEDLPSGGLPSGGLPPGQETPPRSRRRARWVAGATAVLAAEGVTLGLLAPHFPAPAPGPVIPGPSLAAGWRGAGDVPDDSGLQFGTGESANTGFTVMHNPVSLAFTDTTVVTIDDAGQVYSTSLAGQTTSKLARLPAGTGATATDIALSPHGLRAAVVTGGGVTLYNANTGARTGSYAIRLDATAAAVAFSPDGTTLAVADGSGKIDLLTLSGSSVTGVRALHSPGAAAGTAGESLAFSPDGRQLAAANLNETIDLWKLPSGTLEETLPWQAQDTAAAGQAAFGASGQLLAVADGNGTVDVWNVPNQEKIGELTDPSAENPTRVTFSADGGMVAAGLDGGDTDVWALSTGKRLASLTAAPASGPVALVTVTPNNRNLVAYHGYGEVNFWSIPPTIIDILPSP